MNIPNFSTPLDMFFQNINHENSLLPINFVHGMWLPWLHRRSLLLCKMFIYEYIYIYTIFGLFLSKVTYKPYQGWVLLFFCMYCLCQLYIYGIYKNMSLY